MSKQRAEYSCNEILLRYKKGPTTDVWDKADRATLLMRCLAFRSIEVQKPSKVVDPGCRLKVRRWHQGQLYFW